MMPLLPGFEGDVTS